MAPTGRDPRVDEYVEGFEPAHRPIGRAVVGLIRKTGPALQETLKWSQPCWVGRANVLYLVEYTSHVNLGFYRGAHLPNEHGLLEGTGKGLRHIKLRTLSDARSPGVLAAIRAAIELDRSG